MLPTVLYCHLVSLLCFTRSYRARSLSSKGGAMSTLHVLLHGYRNATLQFICFAGVNPISQSEYSIRFCPATSCDLLPLRILTLISILLLSPILSQQPLDRSYLILHRLRLVSPTRPIRPVSYLKLNPRSSCPMSTRPGGHQKEAEQRKRELTLSPPGYPSAPSPPPSHAASYVLGR